MRKIISLLILTFLSSAFCFASPKWITDLEKVFPSEKTPSTFNPFIVTEETLPESNSFKKSE